jgi:hypothetical protein
VRLRFILNNLSGLVPPPLARGHGSRVGGRYVFNFALQEALEEHYLRERKLLREEIQERIATRRLEKEAILAEARLRQSLLKTALFSTLLSEL